MCDEIEVAVRQQAMSGGYLLPTVPMGSNVEEEIEEGEEKELAD